MCTGSVLRVLLGVVLASLVGVRGAPAQSTNPRPVTPPPSSTIPALPPPSSPNNSGLWALMAGFGAVIGITIIRIQLPPDQAGSPPGNLRITPKTTQLPGTP